MHFFRKLIHHRILSGLILTGILLRSIIAVGYMLDTEPVDGSLFTITICDGPAGINAIAGLSSQHDHSQHHEHAHHDMHANHDETHEHAAQDHGFSACSFWSASSQSLTANVELIEPSVFVLSNELIFYNSQRLKQISFNTRFARAHLP